MELHPEAAGATIGFGPGTVYILVFKHSVTVPHGIAVDADAQHTNRKVAAIRESMRAIISQIVLSNAMSANKIFRTV